MRTGLLALACMALFGCSQTLNVCNVDQQVGTVNATSINCGDFVRGSVNYTDEAMLAAQRCVLNALTSKQSFYLVYDADSSSGGMEPGLRAAWIGTSNPDGTLRVQTYAGRGGGDMASATDFVSGQLCDMVDAQQSCKPAVGVPCLACKSTQIATVVCRGT